MATFLLIASSLILVYLSVYALAFIFLSLAAVFLRRSEPVLASPISDPEKPVSLEPVSILIPVWNEGDSLVDAVIAVQEQDYAGRLEIYILVKDGEDNSLPALLKFYTGASDFSALRRLNMNPSGGPDSRESFILFNSLERRISLVLTDKQSKRDKFNSILPDIKTPFIALLDADHRPTRNWLSSSAALFTADNVAAVQTRRRPLGVRHLAQIWDSAQNHFGNELLNSFLAALRRGVFFTGTAAVFKTEILRRFGLRDSITEDTYLSYDLWCAGYRIAYNRSAVSFEEVAPSFNDYISRRRRWSAGHDQVLFRHLAEIFKAPIRGGDKLILWLHGQFYLIPLAVWLLLSIYGFYFFGQLGFNFQLGVLWSAVFFGGLLAFFFPSPGRRILGNWLIGILWFWPQLSVWAIYVYKFMGAENYYYILTFPYEKQWLIWHSVLLVAPLFVLLASSYFFRDSRPAKNLWVIPTYFFNLFLDIYAALLGFFDFIFGRARWSKIGRRNSYSAELLPPEMSANFVSGKALARNRGLWPALSVAGIIFLVILNDLLAVNNCGEMKYFLWPPLILKPPTVADWQVRITKSLIKEGRSGSVSALGFSGDLEVRAVSELAGASGDLVAAYYIDQKLVGTKNISSGESELFSLAYPLGWTEHAVTVSLSGRGSAQPLACYRNLSFSTVLKELRGRDLYINNEKFLIKGLIPSFANAKINLSMSAGLRQIKEAGANTVRFYHGSGEGLMRAAADNQLLVIDQPDRSTWDELDLTSSRQVSSYIRRYEELVKEHEGNPYLLWDGFGNEWELAKSSRPASLINLTNQVLEKANQAVYNWPTSYSTYYTFIKYPVDISGINMLDSGRTYWEKALAIVKSTDKAFYASEFGGFVAFWEKNDPELRVNRLLNDWTLLMRAGALGANFYESHDNWAQPVVRGYNDPFKADQPDDTRGFWDEKNNPKPELKTLEKIFSDFEVKVKDPVIHDASAPLDLAVKNIREYNLKQVILAWPGGSQDLGDFKPGETKAIRAAFGAAGTPGPVALRFAYDSHAGLSGVSRVDLFLPIEGTAPAVLNDDFIPEGQGEDFIRGRLISSSHLDLVLPESWRRFSLNGKIYSRTSPRLDIPLDNPYHAVDDLEFSRDAKSWAPLPDGFQPESGAYYFRFRWPSLTADKEELILSGLGTSRVEFLGGTSLGDISVHSYRENIISASDLGGPEPGRLITFKIYRNQTDYVDKASARRDLGALDLALGTDAGVQFEAPRIFAPLSLELKKIE